MNVPNTLSLLRLCAVPLVPLIYFSGLTGANRIAALIYLAASATDILDGYIARKYNLITRLGRILDPLADKLMAFCVLVCLIVAGHAPLWAGIAVFFKEACMGLGALVVYKKISDVPPSNILGKLSTTVFFSVCFLVMVFQDIEYRYAGTVNTAAFALALALNIAALCIYVGYLFKGRNTKSENRE
ncbi:MAG: CDP-alcohol phosphatidyltransferase family protein [Oscillospiraceae bacterium]|jgi:cardiolipin synthase|nr:CDP-alcohol phosphatidyltransferase family protein [Oscillospiraceae bacterium]